MMVNIITKKIFRIKTSTLCGYSSLVHNTATSVDDMPIVHVFSSIQPFPFPIPSFTRTTKWST